MVIGQGHIDGDTPAKIENDLNCSDITDERLQLWRNRLSFLKTDPDLVFEVPRSTQKLALDFQNLLVAHLSPNCGRDAGSCRVKRAE